MQKQLIQTLKILLTATVLSFGISYAYAWVGPAAAPPTGNTNPPLVSTTDTAAIQTTEGKLVANAGLATMGNVIVANNVNALKYCDENGTICTLGSALGGSAGQWNDVSTGISYTAGNVGIGVVAPAEKLDVSGNINVSGNIRFSDGSSLSTADHHYVSGGAIETRSYFNSGGLISSGCTNAWGFASCSGVNISCTIGSALNINVTTVVNTSTTNYTFYKVCDTSR